MSADEARRVLPSIVPSFRFSRFTLFIQKESSSAAKLHSGEIGFIVFSLFPFLHQIIMAPGRFLLTRQNCLTLEE